MTRYFNIRSEDRIQAIAVDKSTANIIMTALKHYGFKDVVVCSGKDGSKPVRWV